MRIAILGVGGVGRQMAGHLARDPRVSSLVLADQVASRPRAFVEATEASVETKRLRLEDRRDVQRAVRGCDVLANTASPAYNLSLMKLALEAGVDYLDVSGTGPTRPGGPPGILEQLELHARFEKAGRTALLSMGLDPGMTNILARDAADPLDSVEAIRIRSGGTLRFSRLRPPPSFVPLYAKDAFFSDILIRPTVWTEDRLEDRDLLSEEEEYAFPAPVGAQPTFLVSHEEVKTLPRYLGKPVRSVDFKYAIEPNLARAVSSLDGLGLFDESRHIAIDHVRIPFVRALKAAFPDVSDVLPYLRGTKCVAVEVDGFRGGVRLRAHSHIMMPHEAARRRAGTTAVYYLTGAGAAIGALLLGSDRLPGPGVYPPEALRPHEVFEEWTRRRLPLARSGSITPN